jgi:hypothetical protein
LVALVNTVHDVRLHGSHGGEKLLFVHDRCSVALVW